MQAHHIIIDERPLTCWDPELEEKNLEFLDGIDSEYFWYIAENNIGKIDSENKHQAAILLRLTYSHALETLFSLLSASAQAPQCPIGWLLNYKNIELTSVVRKINTKQKIYTKFVNQSVTWRSLSETIHHNLGDEEEKKTKIINGFATTWSRLASEYVDQNFTQEYNGIKHGLRVRPGGFRMAYGREEQPGITASPKKMVSLGGHDFGSSYFVKESIGDAPKHNFRPRRHSRNWDPINIANRLTLISMSINNIVNWLKIINGVDPIKCKFSNPENLDNFDEAWKFSVGLTHSNFDLIVREGDIQSLSKNEVLNFYREK